jgi:hypothetical protein
MAYYSVIKKNEIVLFAGKWIEQEILMLGEVNQAQKDKCHLLFLICATKCKITIIIMIHNYIKDIV